MKTIIALAAFGAFVFGVCALAGAEPENRGSVADLVSMRQAQESPFVTVNGNTCFVSRATTYAPRCHVTPEHDGFPWKRVAVTAGVIAAGAIVGVVMAHAYSTAVFEGAHATGAAFGAIGGGALASAQD